MKITLPGKQVKHAPADLVTDADLVERARNNDPDAFRLIMQRHNQRLFRIARGIVRHDDSAEDIVQEAYFRAFRHLDDFRGESSLSTWLYRIVMNEALGRLRVSSRMSEISLSPDERGAEILRFPGNATLDDPERTMAQRQILQLVEEATDALPDDFRLVFIARIIEGMTVDETAELLAIKPETVRTRLHRARALLRKQIDKQVGPVLLNAFPFAGWRCERLSARVMARLGFEK